MPTVAGSGRQASAPLAPFPLTDEPGGTHDLPGGGNGHLPGLSVPVEEGSRLPATGPAPRAHPPALLAAFCLLFVAWLAFIYPVLGGKVFFPTPFGSPFLSVPATQKLAINPADTDSYQAVYPYHVALGDALRSGHLPLWDPSRFAGVPFAADPGMGTFYPLNWLYALGPAVVIGTLIWAVTLLASLLLAFWFFRLLDLHPIAGALGAIVWTFCGWMVAWSSADPVFQTALWLPLALGGVEVARRGNARRGVPLAGLGLGLSVLAGHTQITYYVWLATGVWTAVAVISAVCSAARRGAGAAGRELARGAGIAVGVFAIGAGLCSIQLFGLAEYAGQIVRQQEPFSTVFGLRVPISRLATFLIPNYFGNPINSNYILAPERFTETALYAGVVTLPLALAGLASRRPRMTIAFVLLILLGMGAAFGTVLLHLLYQGVPGFSRFRWTDRILLLTDVGLAGMAALGLDAVLTRRPAAATWLAVAGAAATAAGVLALITHHSATPVSASYISHQGMRAFAAVLAAGIVVLMIAHHRERQAAAVLLVLLAGIDLWTFGFPYHPFNPAGAPLASTPVTQALAAAPGDRPRFADTLAPDVYPLPSNASMVFPGLYSIDGYDPLIPSSFVHLVTPIQGNMAVTARLFNAVAPLNPTTTESPILDLLGVRSLVTFPGATVPGSEVLGGPIPVYDEPTAFPPAFMAGCWTVAGDSGAESVLAAASSTQLRSSVVVAPGDGSASLPQSNPPCDAGPAASVTAYTPEDVAVVVPAGSTGGILVLTDQWYPGWTATVDGQSVPILRVDLALRGVALSPGAHSIVFRYQPSWPLAGFATMVLTLSIIVLIACYPHRKGRPAAVEEAHPQGPRPPSAFGSWARGALLDPLVKPPPPRSPGPGHPLPPLPERAPGSALPAPGRPAVAPKWHPPAGPWQPWQPWQPGTGQSDPPQQPS